jgi:hypothetical protein
MATVYSTPTSNFYRSMKGRGLNGKTGGLFTLVYFLGDGVRLSGSPERIQMVSMASQFSLGSKRF